MILRYVCGLLLVFLPVLLFAQVRPGELLHNGMFEGGGGSDGRGGGVPEWEPFGVGYDIDRQIHHEGDQSIRCDSLNPNRERGAQIKLELNQKRPVPIAVSGWSKAENARGLNVNDYAIYIDAVYMDGSPLWGQVTPFRSETHDWQRRQVLVVPAKPLKSMTVIALFRNHSGTVWFDDFSAHALQGNGIFDGQPLTLPAVAPTNGAKLRVTGKDGLALDVDPKGGISSTLLNGQATGNAAGGFYLRDVARDGPLVPVRGIAVPRKSGGVNIGQNVPGLRVSFNARLSAEGDSIGVDGELTDLTKADRAISVYLALPVNALGWQWGHDIRHAQTIESSGEYAHLTHVNVGATGGLSLYPYGCIANAQGGVGIASQMDWPSIFRIFYNAPTRQFVIAWDVALTRKTANWPAGNARFRCTLFRLNPGASEECFRAATQRFYALNARAFARRAKPDGLWLPFTNPQTIQNASDFGFAYHEGDTSVKTDDALGLLSFRYSEPMTYWLPMPPSLPRTYDNALALIQDQAKGERKDPTPNTPHPTPYEWAQAVLNSGSQDAGGRFNVEFQNQPWANGAVFTLNPNPELPATVDKPTKAFLTYTLKYAMETYDNPARNKERGELDGEYLDSLESWADVLDYRPSSLASSPYPIPFDTEDRQPVVPQWYSTHTFTQFISQDLHNRSKLLMANTVPVRFAIFAPLLDVMGLEVNWLASDGKWQPDGDELFNFRRTLSRQKPYLLLMNTDFNRLTPPLVEKYFQRSLFYGVFPSMFSADAATHPYWETPAWYNRDRPLFQKYVPIIKRLSASRLGGLCTHARTSDPNVYVERYGTRLFTLFNDSSTPKETTLTSQHPRPEPINGNPARFQPAYQQRFAPQTRGEYYYLHAKTTAGRSRRDRTEVINHGEHGEHGGHRESEEKENRKEAKVAKGRLRDSSSFRALRVLRVLRG